MKGGEMLYESLNVYVSLNSKLIFNWFYIIQQHISIYKICIKINLYEI